LVQGVKKHTMTSFVQAGDGSYRLTTSAKGLCIGVVAKSANTVVYGRDPAEAGAREKELLQRITGIRKKDILALNQMHGDTIITVDAPPAKEAPADGDADGFIISLPAVCIVIRTADCVPVFVFDRERRILGAVHSGWRGTRLSIARKLVNMMKERYGAENRDMLAYILPSIGPETYTVREDVAGLFPRDIDERDGLLYLDLWRNIERSLREEGLPDENIFNASVCTLKNQAGFFSYRGGDKGRNLNFGFME
jgi:YfiH family protein